MESSDYVRAFCIYINTMKKSLTLLIVLLSIVLLAALSSDKNPRIQATESFQSGLSEFTQSCQLLLHSAARLRSHEASFKDFSLEVRNCRNTFKRIETLAEYFDAEMVGDHINGAPLPKIERKAPQLVIFAPKGLQRLDELAAEQNDDEIEEAYLLSTKLLEAAKRLELHQSKIKIYDRHIFEACRLEVIRNFSLGLTGFDAPGNLNSIEEARIVFQNLSYLLGLYQDQIREKDKALSSNLSEHLKLISEKIEASKFQDLDRLDLLKSHILPLYAFILEAQQVLFIELPHEVNSKKSPSNYQAESFFDNDFLNPSFYSQIHEKDKNEGLYQLGEELFYDPILSMDGQMACVSCHNPNKAFADGLAKSLSRDSSKTVMRNAPSLINSIFATRFFHDMRAARIQTQVEHVIFSENEFSTDYSQIIEKLETDEHYRDLFNNAFHHLGSNRINPFTVAQAISAYVETLHSWNSSFDRYVRNESDEMSESAKRGFNLFMGKANCGTCHFAPSFAGLVPPLFKETESEVLGVTSSFDTLNPYMDEDLGRYANGRVKEKTDFYKNSFKTVTVRNVAASAPYFHNGAFETHEEVKHFYNKGGGAGLGLSLEHQTLSSEHLGLSQQEMNDIISFMTSLTDTSSFSREGVSKTIAY